MTVNIIACGDSAKYWDGSGFSIGVNDAAKWGHKLNCLLVANHPQKFPQDRLEIIKRSQPEKFISQIESWKTYFPNMERIKLRSWDGHFYKETFFHTDTSPTIAMDYARKLGATEIILWGVDLVDHKIYNVHNPQSKTELRQIKQITEALRGEGIQVSLGATGSVLSDFLPIKIVRE